MNTQPFIRQMDNNARRIQLLVEGITDEQARWKPTPETWSVLEVVNHLYDEEREDFRLRLDYILHHPGEKWPSNDPQGNILNRRYNERDLQESLNNFLQERQASLEWIQKLGVFDWDKAEATPWGGRSVPEICLPHGWRTIFCTCASWSNCIGRLRIRRFNRIRLNMRETGKFVVRRVLAVNQPEHVPRHFFRRALFRVD